MENTNVKHKEKTESVKQVSIQKDLKRVGSLKPHKGHILFEYNKVTTEMRKADFEIIEAQFITKSQGTKKRVVMNENCVYIPALNLKNAFKKIGLKATIIKSKK